MAVNAPEILAVAGLELERAIKIKLSQPGSGRLYPRGDGKFHQASAPGEPPAPDRGVLRESVGQEINGDRLRVGIGPPAEPEQPIALEFGTPTIEPRPFMRPALEEVRDLMTDVLVAELRKVDIVVRRA